MNYTKVSVVLNDINVPENKLTNDAGTTSFDIDRITSISSLNNSKKSKTPMRKNSKKITKHKDSNQEIKESPANKVKENVLCKEHKLKDHIEHDFKKNSSPVLENTLKFKDFFYVNEHDPGGCKTLHCYQDEVRHLKKEKYQEFVNEFLDLAMGEVRPGVPLYSMAVMHQGASHLPDLLEYLATKYPSLVIKRMLMGRSDVETLSMKEYREKVISSYSAGTYRCGPLLQLSMVGRTSEESGAYMEELLDLMEKNYLIKAMMPWGERSCLEGMARCRSNDGPIVWCRCGEQVVPPMDAVNRGTPKKRGINELRRLQYLPRASEAREVVVEDRTKCHADQVGGLLQKQSTAAVGVLKAVHASHPHSSRRVVKEVVCVSAENFEAIVDRLKLDLLEPPMTQCVTWLDDARLNQLNREGIKTGRVTLRDNDVYVIPRNVVHQFKTITATTSVAWHVRMKEYHQEDKCSCGRVEERVVVGGVGGENDAAGVGTEVKSDMGSCVVEGKNEREREGGVKSECGGEVKSEGDKGQNGGDVGASAVVEECKVRDDGDDTVSKKKKAGSVNLVNKKKKKE